MSSHAPAARRDPWVVIPRPTPNARLRLFCFPYAGGGASIFAPWGRAVHPSVEVVAVQLPGREARLAEKAFANLTELVDAVTPVLAPYMDRPFALFGHSNGGLMAYEVTRRLRREGRPGPVQLFIGGRPAPQVVITDPPIWNLPHGEFLDALRRFAGTPEEVLQNQEIMELIEPTLRADFSLGETYAYVPDRPLAIPISAWAGERDGEVPTWQVEAWKEQTTSTFRFVEFPGDHFFLNSDRDQVLAELNRELAGILGRLGVAPLHA